MFGDNQSVITSSTVPHSALTKRHNALSYHCVREAIAAKILCFCYIEGVNNPADVLSKHSGYPQFRPLIRPLLFWRGNTLECPDGTKNIDLKVPKAKGDSTSTPADGTQGRGVTQRNEDSAVPRGERNVRA